MIIKQTKIIKNISEAKADNLKAYELNDSIYGVGKEEFEFNVNKATGMNYRLIHDNKTAFIVKGDDKNSTESIHNIEEFKTEKECLDRIEELGLIYTQPDTESEI